MEVSLPLQGLLRPSYDRRAETAPEPPAAARALPGAGGAPGADAVHRALDQAFASPDFDGSRRSREFLRFIVEETLAGRGKDLSQSAIALEVFGRRADFDALTDPIVRIQAGRLRRSLERYYLLAGGRDPVRIELPKGGYGPVFRWERDPVAEAGGADGSLSRAVAAGWPAIALKDLEGAVGATDAELAVRVNEELALELGRYGIVRVFQGADDLAPTRVRFELRGRIRREGGDLGITARLVDRSTGEQVWGDGFRVTPLHGHGSGSPEDVARVIAAHVGSEEGVIVQYLAAEGRKQATAAPTPFDAFLRSYEFFLARDPHLFLPAVEALRQVVATQPDCGLAWTRLARLYAANHSYEVTPAATPLADAITCAINGVHVDPSSRSARCTLAATLLVAGEMEAGRREVDQALRLSPGSLANLDMIGLLLALFGEWDRGAALIQEARERNPHCLPHVLFGEWAGHVRRGEAELAYQTALEYRDPTFFWRSVMRASCLGLLGRTPEAKSEVAGLLARKPDFPERGRALLGHYLKFPEVMNPVVTGLARAGLELA